MSSRRDKVGVILAAGFGSRLAGEDGADSPKPLIRVGGSPLILRAARGLGLAGCDRVVVVLGFESEGIRSALLQEYDGAVPLSFVTNPRFDLQNGVSVLASDQEVEDLFILVMADHVVGDDVMRLAGEHAPVPGGATLLVDYDIEGVFDLDDATKVLEEGNRIVSIGKTISDYNCIDTGVFVCTSGLMDSLRSYYEEHGDVSLSNGVQNLAAAGLMRTLDIQGGFWQDVDTPEMLAHAEKALAERNGG